MYVVHVLFSLILYMFQNFYDIKFKKKSYLFFPLLISKDFTENDPKRSLGILENYFGVTFHVTEGTTPMVIVGFTQLGCPVSGISLNLRV